MKRQYGLAAGTSINMGVVHAYSHRVASRVVSLPENVETALAEALPHDQHAAVRT